MGRTSNVSGLRTRLEQKSEQERRQIEALMRSELGKLSKNLRSIVESEQATIERDTRQRMEAAARRIHAPLNTLQSVNEVLTRAWLRPVVIGLGLFLGILGGSWGLTRWLSNEIEGLLQTRAELTVEIEEQQRTVERLKQTTWGVALHEGNEGGRFVVLPPGALEDPPWTVGGRPAIRLSSE